MGFFSYPRRLSHLKPNPELPVKGEGPNINTVIPTILLGAGVLV